MLGCRACGIRTDEVRSAALFGPAARQLLLLHKIGQTAPHQFDPQAGVFVLDDRRRQKVGEPEIVARLKKRARIGLEPRVRSSAACASAGYDRI
jgi:hypothetical protein